MTLKLQTPAPGDTGHVGLNATPGARPFKVGEVVRFNRVAPMTVKMCTEANNLGKFCFLTEEKLTLLP